MTTQYAPPVAPERFAHIKATDAHRKDAFAWLLHHNQNMPTRNEVELMAQCMAEEERIRAALAKVQA